MVYAKAAYSSQEAEKYSWTSMVVRTADGHFYQIRNGHEGVFLCFDTKSRTWSQLFTAHFTLHTLAVKDDANIYFTSSMGLGYQLTDSSGSPMVLAGHTASSAAL